MNNFQKKSQEIYKPFLLLAVFTIMAISSTVAYFTNSSQSEDNIFTSGNLKIELTQDDVLSVQDWSPGSEYSMEFSINNTGNISEYVKGYLGGSWNEQDLDSSVFEIIKLERKIKDTWIVVNNEGLSIGEEFFLSSDGTINTLLELKPGESEQFRLTTRLNEFTSDEYQNKTFTASLHLAAKQSIFGSEWPMDY